MPDKVPFQVGLTGGIGSGKSTVAMVFHLLGVPVYESDDAAKDIYFIPRVKQLVLSLLGPEAYFSETKLNSKWIGDAIYSNPELLKDLNGIIHPEVGTHYERWLSCQTFPYVLKVAALIFEANIYKQMNLNILVTAPMELKIERVLSRDHLREKEQLKKIMQLQFSDDDKMKLSDRIVKNDNLNSLIFQVSELHKVILNISY